MSWLSDLPVQRKLGFAMLITTTVALVAACGVFLAVEYVGYRRNILRNVATLAQISADNSTAAIAFHDKRGARENLEVLRAEPQIVAAVLYGTDGQVVASYTPRPDETLTIDMKAPTGVRLERGYVIAVQPVVEGSRRLGTLYVQATMEQIYARMRTYGFIVAGVLASSIVLAGLIASVLRRTLAQPILELAETAGAISENQDYSRRARQYGRDELGQLTAAFNAMLDRTQSAVDGLRESEWTHRELVRALPTAAYMCNADGLITLFNEAAVTLWGRTPQLGQEYWCGSSKMFRLDGSPLPLDQSSIAVTLREGRPVRGEEIIIERPDGTRRNVMPHPEPIRDTSGKMVGIVNMLLDITDQKKATATARQLASIVESSNEAILSKDLNGNITSWNRGAELLFGYSAAEMTGKSVELLIPSEQQNEEPEILRKIRSGELIENYETIRVRRDGSRVDVSLSISPINDLAGNIVGASKIARDITDRKRTAIHAHFLSQLSHELSLLTEPADIISAASRSVGRQLGTNRCYFFTVNENVDRITVEGDWTHESLAPIGGDYEPKAFGTPSLWRSMGEKPMQIRDTSTDPFTREFYSGYEQRNIRAHASVPFLREGRWISAIAITSHQPSEWRKDEMALLENVISRVWPMVERARSQAELRESARRQRDLLRALPVPCYVIDAEGRLTLFNDAAVELWGFTPQLGASWTDDAPAIPVAAGDSLPSERSLVALALREKRAVRGVEASVMRPDGSRRWVVPHPDPIFDAHGNCTGVVNVIMDVTEERIAHEKVQKTAAHLNLAITAGSLGDWNWDAVTDIISLSPRTQEIFGVASSAGFTRSSMRDLLHEDDRERTRVALRHAIETHTDYDIEYRVNRPDGSQCWVAAKGRSTYGEDGKATSMVGVIQDITERKLQAEKLEKLARELENQSRLFDATLSNLSDLAYAFDRQGRFIFANKPLLDLWGRTLADIVGKTTFELDYPADVAARIQREVQEAISTKQAVRSETTFVSANGKVDEHEYILNPVIAPDGEVTAVVGSTRIITERKRAEETLRQSEAQLRLVTDNAPVLLVRIDLQHRFTFVNRAYAERIGLKPSEMIGKDVGDIVGAEAYASFKPQMEEALAGARVEFEQEVPYARLGQRWIHVIYVPERDSRGVVTGILGVITEIGERKQAEIELKRARDEAVAASRAKDDFLAALSHELRTPLNPVLLLASDAASNQDLPPPIRADFELIRKNIDLEARLIDDLLDLTRISHGKLQLHQRDCDIHDVLQDAIANIRSDLASKRIQLNVDLAASHSTVRGDSVRLQQVFWNILKNAVKFTPQQGTIHLSTQVSANGQLVVKVTDTGIGMTTEELSRAFQAFTQGEHATQASSLHRFGGLGLGLAITKMLVDLHHGAIQASSEGRDLGSTFVVELPLIENSKMHPELPAKSLPASASKAEPVPADSEKPSKKPNPALRRVLLVEDHAATRTTLQFLLRKRNYEVIAADCAAKAEELAAANTFDVIISDVGLPDRNGYELMTALRVSHPHLLGIALSGYGMEDDLNRSRTAGFSLHLVKPVTIRMLEDAIERLPTLR